MPERTRHSWRTKEMRELFDAISRLETRSELETFFRDLGTLSELEAMAHRWQVARLLEKGLPYLEIAQRTGASTTTGTRGAHWLRHGEGASRAALHQGASGGSRSRRRAASASRRTGSSRTPGWSPSSR